MYTLSLQTTNPQTWVAVDQVLATIATASHQQTWGRVYALKQTSIVSILKTAIALIQAHPVTIILDAHPQVADEQPLTKASAIATQALPIAIACFTQLVITHQVFWQLPHTGSYNLRLIAQFQTPKSAERVSLFEIFNGDPAALRDRKQDSKTQFEQALFLFFLGFQAEAACLFQDCVTQCPGDTVALYYAQKCAASPPTTSDLSDPQAHGNDG